MMRFSYYFFIDILRTIKLYIVNTNPTIIPSNNITLRYSIKSIPKTSPKITFVGLAVNILILNVFADVNSANKNTLINESLLN